MSASLVICVVLAVTDGDTLKARCGTPDAYQQVTIRLAEIDAPEKRQAYGGQSQRALATLCLQEVARIKDRGRDRYGRTLADVQCRGADAGRYQVAQGMAWVFDRYVTDRALYEVQEEAQRERKGLWSDALAVAPWVRRGK